VATAKPLSRTGIRPATAAPARRPFRDNPPLILAGIIILLAALGGIVWLADRTATLSPDFLTEVVLIALSVTNVTMLLALVFVLARNVIKSLVEGRRGLPFGRFRAKLVLAILGMTVIPSVLVMIVGSRVHARTRYSSDFKASNISHRHSFVRRSMIPVEAAEETLVQSKRPVR